MQGETNLDSVLKEMRVYCDDKKYGFGCSANRPSVESEGIIGLFKEKEGITVIGILEELNRINLTAVEGPYAKITIEVHTSLELVGLTALLSERLKVKKVPANVVAGFYHDHIFVPYGLKDLAMKALMDLSNE